MNAYSSLNAAIAAGNLDAHEAKEEKEGKNKTEASVDTANRIVEEDDIGGPSVRLPSIEQARGSSQ